MEDSPHEEPKPSEGSNGVSEDKKTDDSRSSRNRSGTEPDAQEMVIASLRTQIQDLFSQVSQLNNKLVQSYDRVSNLEDDLHIASSNIRASSVKISQLELERAQHLSALNTGLLVEKSHVTSELSRLMEKATDEAAQRGQAESARAAIEKELDDLSASLFGQANSMVAEARFARHLSERKVEDAERALKGAEEAVSLMQQQMQSMQAEKEEAEKKVLDMEAIMGKGKWVARRDSQPNIARQLRLLSSHLPYQEFLLFIGHLRSLHPTSPNPPAMNTILPLPFLARLSTEDSEPTVRLDLAPSLNWLSRRSVLSAIHTGQLTVEPISTMSLLSETTSYSTSTTVAGLNNSNDSISCSLCGCPIVSIADYIHSRPSRPPAHPLSNITQTHSYSNSWSTTLFKKTASSMSQPSTPPRSPSRATAPPYPQIPQQLYIFRLDSPPSSTISSIPIPSIQSHQTPSMTPSTTIYPLCTSGWCLNRLRATCTLWAFVRTGIVEKIWEEDIPAPAPTPMLSDPAASEKHPVPPRKRGLWGIASAITEKAASWSEGEKGAEKTKKQEEKRLPLPPPLRSGPMSVQPPPVHPTLAPPPEKSKGAAPGGAPPPLPRRSEGRNRRTPPLHEMSEEANKDIANGTSPPSNGSSPLPPHLPARTVAPANVPLPESRPATPVNLHPPSRTGSPAAPPPIPRRAAARKLPGSRPGTPSNLPPTSESKLASAPSTEDQSEKLNVTDTSSAPNVAVEISSPSSSPEKSEDNNEEDKVTEDSAPKESNATKELSTDGEKASEQGANTSAEVEDVFVDASELVQETTRESSPTVNGDDDTAAAQEKNMATEGNAEVESGAETGVEEVIEEKNGQQVETTAEKTAVDNAEKSTEGDKLLDEEGDKNYVGALTWEERTWREIVRLREEMFWARVGGLR